jgi:hypothetical protein
MIGKYQWLIFGLSLATFNLALSYYFRENIDHFNVPTLAEAQWFFIAKPAFNWGGFFVDGDSPTIHRLPTVLFLLWASIGLGKYLLAKRTALQSLSASMLLGGLGGLALDIFSYGSVCDWLGFSFPSATFYSMLNISDLMILVSAPVVAIVCFQRLLFSIPAFIFAIAVIGANTYYHFNYLFFGTHPRWLCDELMEIMK